MMAEARRTIILVSMVLCGDEIQLPMYVAASVVVMDK